MCVCSEDLSVSVSFPLPLPQPHLGTDRLIGILRAFRAQLLALGVQIRWGTLLRSVDVRAGSAVGVHMAGELHYLNGMSRGGAAPDVMRLSCTHSCVLAQNEATCVSCKSWSCRTTRPTLR